MKRHFIQKAFRTCSLHDSHFDHAQEGTQELQGTFQQILQTPQLTESALLLEAAVDQELQRMRTVRSLNSLLRDHPQTED